MLRIFQVIFSLVSLLSFQSSAQISFCSGNRFDQEVFSTVNVTNNITYGLNYDATGNLTTLQLDFYEPAGDTMQQRPVIVWAHGGSFMAGSRNTPDMVSLCNHFAKRGYVCISISYRLGIPFPINSESATKAVYRSMQDMKAAIRFLRKDAATNDQYKIDPNIIFAGGSSAGAFTALHVAYLDEYSELLNEIDTTGLGDLEGDSGNSGYPSDVSAVIDLCGALGDKSFISAGDIPFVAMHGTIDGTVPYSTAMIYLLGAIPVMIVDGSYAVAEYADSVGVLNEMYTYYGADHVPYVTDAAYMDTTVRFVSNFLYRRLGCTPSDPSPLANTFNTGVEELDEDLVSVFPNPGQGIFRFYINDNASNSEITVFDLRGTILLRSEKINSGFSIDLNSYSRGVYFYRLRCGNKFSVGKLIKE